MRAAVGREAGTEVVKAAGETAEVVKAEVTAVATAVAVMEAVMVEVKTEAVEEAEPLVKEVATAAVATAEAGLVGWMER